MPSVPVVGNFEARAVSTAEEIRHTLARARSRAPFVGLNRSLSLVAHGHTLSCLELGPDTAIAGMMKRIDKTAKVISIGDLAGLEKAVAELMA